MPIDQLDLQAVGKADERFWAKHPELHKRTLTSESSDAGYRSEWLELYNQEVQNSLVHAPSVLPKPLASPPPVNATSPVQACAGVASLTHEEKMQAAIHSANLGEDVLREIGDIKTLVATMVIVGGGLAVAGVAAAATGVGLLVEGVAAAGAGLLVLGAAMSGWQIGQGLDSLYDFFQQTRCDTATTPQQLHQAGQKFGDGVAKVGIGTVNLLLSILGGRGKNWRGQGLPKQAPIPKELTELRAPARPLLENEGVPLKADQGLQSRTAGRFDRVVIGSHGDPATKYLWTFDQRGLNIAPEKTPFPTPRGNIVHTNLSSQASVGGEAWFTAEKEVTINAGSGRFGAGSGGASEEQYQAAAKYWEALGYKVRVVPNGQR